MLENEMFEENFDMRFLSSRWASMKLIRMSEDIFINMG